MKKLLLLSSLLCFWGVLFISCNTTEVEKVEDYTYSISKVFWSDPVDNNKDGFATNKVLGIHVNLAEDVTRNIDVRLYFRAVGATTYSFYGSMNDLEFVGVNSPLTVQFMIGPPLQRELLHGTYDFKVEIHESGNDNLEAIAEKDDTDIDGATLLGNQKFESLATDQIYSIDVRWKDITDENENGFATQASLIIDVNIEQDLTKEVKIELYKREQSNDNYTIYETTQPFQIQYNSVEDSILIDVGVPPRELEKGTYNLKLVVYETGIYSPVAVLEPSSDSEMAGYLEGRKFETRIDDGYFYSIDTSNIYWSDRVDINGNDTTYSRKLNLNINVDKDEPRAVWAKVYYKETSSSELKLYNTYYENSPWQIQGGESNTDIMSIEIGTVGTLSPVVDTSKYLHKNGYDFLVNIFEAGDERVVTYVSTDESDSLFNQAFETASEDSL